MKRKKLYIIGGGVLTAIALYIGINRIVKAKMIDEIYEELNGTTGDREIRRIKRIMSGKMSAKLTDAFNPLFYRTMATRKIGNPIPKNEAIAKAKQINDAWGILGDDEEKVYGALRGLPSKASVSFVAFWYNKQHGSDLFADLNYKLSDNEKKIAFGIVERLKSF